MSTIKQNDEIINELRRFIATEYLLDGQTDDLQITDLLFEGGIIDSAGAISLIMHIEQFYSIEINDEELFPSNFATIEHIVRFIEKKQNSSSNDDFGER